MTVNYDASLNIILRKRRISDQLWIARNGNRLEMFRFAQQDSAIYGARSSS